MKHYIDLGAHFGEGYERIKNMVGIDDSWNVSLFEPNPLCYGPLLSRNIKGRLFSLAVSDRPTITGFDLQLCHDGSNFALDGFGSALTGIGSDEKGLKGVNVNVMCVTLAQAIKMSVGENPIDELHIKIDIEGAEYSLDYSCLPKDRLVYLYIEWHNWGCEYPNERRAEILSSLPLNIVCSDWD
jgi:FkbM family methyltransferase